MCENGTKSADGVDCAGDRERTDDAYSRYGADGPDSTEAETAETEQTAQEEISNRIARLPSLHKSKEVGPCTNVAHVGPSRNKQLQILQQECMAPKVQAVYPGRDSMHKTASRQPVQLGHLAKSRRRAYVDPAASIPQLEGLLMRVGAPWGYRAHKSAPPWARASRKILTKDEIGERLECCGEGDGDSTV